MTKGIPQGDNINFGEATLSETKLYGGAIPHSEGMQVLANGPKLFEGTRKPISPATKRQLEESVRKR